MINLDKMFSNYSSTMYESPMYENMNIEIRINNCKVATFYDKAEAQNYIDELSSCYNKFTWFIISDKAVIVFVFYKEEVCK